MRRALFVACLASFPAISTHAEVARLEIVFREPFAGGVEFGAVGAYEKLTGRLHYAVEPENPANS
jgi:hypothetical protein